MAKPLATPRRVEIAIGRPEADAGRRAASAPRSRARRMAWWWSAGVFLAATLPYLNALPCGFALDDFGLVVQNRFATQDMSPFAWFARESTTGSLYRPVTMMSYALNHALSPLPFGYHLTNVALHALASVAAFHLARVLLRSIPSAAAVGLIFAVHPIHTEPVTNLAGRAEVLAGLFAFVSLIAFARAHDSKRAVAWMALSLVAFGAAVLSKESAVVTVGLAGLVALWLWRPHLPELARGLFPFVVVAAGFVALRVWITGSLTLQKVPPFYENPLAHTGLWPRLGTAVVVIGEYLSALAIPIRLSADDSFDQVPVVASPADPRLLVTVAVLLALGVATWRTRHRRPVLALAASFFIVAMAITANVLFPIGVMKAERLLYVPSFAVCLAAGWTARRWVGRSVNPRLAVVGLALALLAGRTWIRNDDWQSNYTILMKTVATSPSSARAHANAAAMAANAGDLDFAREHFSAALRIMPDFRPAAEGLARVERLLGQAGGATRSNP